MLQLESLHTARINCAIKSQGDNDFWGTRTSEVGNFCIQNER